MGHFLSPTLNGLINTAAGLSAPGSYSWSVTSSQPGTDTFSGAFNYSSSIAVDGTPSVVTTGPTTVTTSGSGASSTSTIYLEQSYRNNPLWP